MYVNDRDQINYHGFLYALRTMREYSLHQVCTGICCESGMHRFENGNRVAEKLVRDRLTARMGISCEQYEDYLQPKEYVRWEQRLRIIKAIEKKDLKTAKRELSKYTEFSNLNRTNQQFMEAMRYMILGLEGASKEGLRDCIRKAVKLTVPNITKHFEEECLLSDQEINLLLEQMSLEEPKKVIKDVDAWRVSEYEKLITYMDSSCWEKLQKAKVYPRVTYFICKELMNKELAESEIRRGLELCHNAIELLRDTSRLYYFIELTEVRRALAERLMEVDIPVEEKSQLEEMLTENNQWEKVFKDLYAEYKVAPYMSDFCYLYYENECHNMVEVIEMRRIMLGISRARLSDGVCAERTIVRMEREGVNPTIDVARRLFDKMGMCAEYKRTRLVSNDERVIHLSIKLASCVNNYDSKGMEQYISELKDLVVLDLPFNRQEILRNENKLLFREKKISEEEYERKAIEGLEYTLPIKALMTSDNLYVTRNELSCIYDLAFETTGRVSELCLGVIEKICQAVQENKFESLNLVVHEVVLGRLASYYGDVGRYEESCRINQCLLKECLINYRMDVLSDNIYGILWNKKQQHRIDIQLEKACLEKCVLLCHIIRKTNWEVFFQQKLRELS